MNSIRYEIAQVQGCYMYYKKEVDEWLIDNHLIIYDKIEKKDYFTELHIFIKDGKTIRMGGLHPSFKGKEKERLTDDILNNSTVSEFFEVFSLLISDLEAVKKSGVYKDIEFVDDVTSDSGYSRSIYFRFKGINTILCAYFCKNSVGSQELVFECWNDHVSFPGDFLSNEIEKEILDFIKREKF